jgi:hypothetical protein
MSSSAPIILCEGKGDVRFFEKLIETRALGDFLILSVEDEYAGVGKFGERLKGLTLDDSLASRRWVILIADNDGKPKDRFRIVRKQIKSVKEYGFGVPGNPRVQARSRTMPPVIVLMIPWDTTRGCPETLCLTSASEKRPMIAECVEKYVECVGATSWERAKLDKLKLACFVAAALPKNPTMPWYRAWSPDSHAPSDLIPLHHECFNQIADWLKNDLP